VLAETLRRGGPAAGTMRSVSTDLHNRTGRTAGNGSLMRTGPVALAHLRDGEAMVEAARLTSALTHADPVAGDACALWCCAIAHAVRTGELDVRVGLPHVDAAYWRPLLDEAETVAPAHYAASNRWVVAALLGAWSAISRTTGVVPGLHAAVAGGGDTDTVAAIAGQLLGAAYGASAVPATYRRRLHGWPGLRVRDLQDGLVARSRPELLAVPDWHHSATLDSQHERGTQRTVASLVQTWQDDREPCPTAASRRMQVVLALRLQDRPFDCGVPRAAHSRRDPVDPVSAVSGRSQRYRRTSSQDNGFAVLLAQGWNAVEAISAIRADRPQANVWYAADALDWYHARRGVDADTAARQRSELAGVREGNQLDVVRMVREIREAEQQSR
jgi:hypothetical protein